MADNMFERLENTYTIDSIHRLSQEHVCIIGLGGGGCAVAEILARTGVHNFILIDGDTFEDTNKNRQIGALNSTLGKYKVEVMADRLKDINPDIQIECIREFITRDNYIDIICPRKIDIICDTVDGSSKLIVADVCEDLKIPYITGGCGGYSWFTAPIDNIKCKGRDIWGYPENDDPGFSPSANPASVFIQAGFQAQEIINFLLGRDWGMRGNKIVFNHMNYTFAVRDISDNEE